MPTDDPASDPLLDRSGVRRTLGVSRHVAGVIFELLPQVRVPGVRRAFVKASDLDRAIRRWTVVEPRGDGAVTRRTRGGPAR